MRSSHAHATQNTQAFRLSRQAARDSLDRFEPGTEPRHRLAIALELSVGKVPNPEVADPLKCRSSELRAYLVLAVIGRDQEQPARRVSGCSEREIEQSDDARIDRGRVLDLESGGH